MKCLQSEFDCAVYVTLCILVAAYWDRFFERWWVIKKKKTGQAFPADRKYACFFSFCGRKIFVN